MKLFLFIDVLAAFFVFVAMGFPVWANFVALIVVGVLLSIIRRWCRHGV